MGVKPNDENLSRSHRTVADFLVSLGLVVELEKRIGPYSVDVYLPELRFVIEIDGPFLHHSQRREERRDEELKQLGVAEVIHVTSLAKGELETLARRLGYEGCNDKATGV